MAYNVASSAGVGACVVGTVPTVPALALADLTAAMPSIPDYVAAQVEAARTDPVLCIQPMTARDAAYQEGRRAGLREATAAVEEALDGDECDCAMGMPLGTDIHKLPTSARCTPCRVREALAKAGEP